MIEWNVCVWVQTARQDFLFSDSLKTIEDKLYTTHLALLFWVLSSWYIAGFGWTCNFKIEIISFVIHFGSDMTDYVEFKVWI